MAANRDEDWSGGRDATPRSGRAATSVAALAGESIRELQRKISLQKKQVSLVLFNTYFDFDNLKAEKWMDDRVMWQLIHLAIYLHLHAIPVNTIFHLCIDRDP